MTAGMLAVALSLAASAFAAGQEPAEQRMCPALAPGWAAPGDGLPHHHRYILGVGLRGRDIVLAGRTVSPARLRVSLSRARRMIPAPFILYDPSQAADCAAAASVRDLIHEAARCGHVSQCGQGSLADWRAAPGW